MGFDIKKTFSTRPERKKAVLVALVNQEQHEEKVSEYLSELAFLASTLGLQCVYSFTQKLEKPDVRSFVGKGKLEEIRDYIHQHDIDIVIFDDDLSPSQLRNIEKVVKCQIYDRSLLILDIFLKRAKTSQAKTQVELARYQYLLPRLTRMWTHLERQRGGTATRGGAGEKEIETDRRIIRNQIGNLKKKLEKIERQNEIQRKSRKGIVRVALVGYTNVGKSTLMRLLAKTDVLTENKLFATVDSTVRKVVIDHIPFLLSDTVGFIRKLPHHLIESFKSTLDEIREADLLLHVVDISHPGFSDHVEIVNQTLSEIGADNKAMIMVYNKVDLVEKRQEKEENGEGDFDPRSLLPVHLETQSVFISASEKININLLREMISKKIRKKHYKIYPNQPGY